MGRGNPAPHCVKDSMEHSTSTEVHHETAKPGMPQLDPTYFASQLFWLAVTFVVMYVLMSKWMIPRIAKVIETREGKIATDLAAAQDAKAQAQAAITAYEKDMVAAREAANATINQAQAAISEMVSKEQNTVDAKLVQDVAKAEQQIAAKAAETRESLKPAIAEIAALMVEKVMQSEAAPIAPAKVKVG